MKSLAEQLCGWRPESEWTLTIKKSEYKIITCENDDEIILTFCRKQDSLGTMTATLRNTLGQEVD